MPSDTDSVQYIKEVHLLYLISAESYKFYSSFGKNKWNREPLFLFVLQKHLQTVTKSRISVYSVLDSETSSVPKYLHIT